VRLVWRKYDYYDPFWIIWGLISVVVGVYGLFAFGFRGPSILWLLRAIIAMPVAWGIVILVRQYQLRPKR
jgi:hypothetical protein